MRFVLDASVAVSWFAREPGREGAMRWLDRFEDDPDLFVVPDLFAFETLGAFARLAASLGETWARESLTRLRALEIPVMGTTDIVLDRALALAVELRLGGYDAIYLAHADATGWPWLTADEKAIRRLKGDARVRFVGQAPRRRST
jgi:predicted nucleic acid-binding protein